MSDASPLPLYAIGLGSNRRHARFGDPRRVLLAAMAAIEAEGIEAVDASAIAITEPLGPSRRCYANAAMLVATRLDPPAMLERLKTIEARFGRRRGQRWGARTLDLDLLLWSEGIWSDAHLTVPHGQLTQRLFVLGPLAAIVPNWRHPVSGRTIRQHHMQLLRAKPVDREPSAL
ncbi:2-amino-4-hydroxy-6-hydroxymethyldihydropteridine diphosphokinase [Sphingopyxis sp. MWB1]|uniref:2-amino-4-hydroxy-6- hydroxymethyldihydropteridine diphosphokinase n=1 Tax=Sphingopyxis sp. MWB1 TaxID=1537715 RepID=UPI00051A428B|nr:2-amino-4-hydroxy-6-hydroxymethyldihydropteridine diphosphokinase [Sphingopyxis sp. MWB1]